MHDKVHVFLVLIQVFGPDDDIIYVHMTPMAYVFEESSHHSMLMDWWHIFQPHWHDDPFVQAERCGDGSQGHVVRVNQGLKEGIGYVVLRPNFSLSTIHEDIINMRQRMCI